MPRNTASLRRRLQAESLFVFSQDFINALIESRPSLQYPFGKTDTDDRIDGRPIPAVMGVKALEQGFASGKQSPQHVQKQ